jgi:voltage-gated potassium channel
MTFRRKTYQTLEYSAIGRRGLSLSINIFLVTIIVLNSLAIILHTLPHINKNKVYDRLFLDFEIFSVTIFSIEYMLRIWSCVENPDYKDGWRGRLKYVFSFWGVIDLLGIMPFYLTFFTSDLGVIRILRIFRLFRLFRVSRYSHALKLIQDVIKETKEELLLSFSFILFVLLIGSSAMYFLEHTAQPSKFSSIPASLWWGVITMTTTGYGDIYPVTIGGKFFGGIFSILGVALFALPTGILASGFIDHIRNSKVKKQTRCPHCGERLDVENHHKHN